ncbi:RnfABCDGE type electron transport complex subunit D [Williamwhitmania taraxaci]|uniref:Ion-translocating oxidoreductase complex subunit D n=1 Tax=Williamwhitmania taraxaci TaxID=1640674 RepID=A0A1G6SKS3_9BACT|nr:RnfABCDGE type electron transport complex subunit D [Williamwhitmania taraxaci]SDD17502.1 electron transport complex protein RnfD [Williamwhitmania taraxaci]
MGKMFTVAPSPHLFGKESVRGLMLDVVIALSPAFLVSIFYFGIDALVVTAISVASCLLFEFLIQKFLMKTKPTITDGSALVTGILLAFNLPTNIPIFLIVIGALVAIGVGKMSFGGLGNNPFNPALVGRVFLLISFPVQMTSWPLPIALQTPDAITGATPLAVMKEALKSGHSVSDVMAGGHIPSFPDMLMGNMGGSLGEIAALALILGGVYLLVRKVITWHIPVAVLGSVALFSFLLNLGNPERFVGPAFHLLTGGIILGAIYMATDYVSSPMSRSGMILFGVMIGVITVLIRVFGAYPEGVSFAILIMNGFVPLINMYMKPKRFGEAVKNGR